jgi:nucleoside-diphosphate-sugar epimerase
VFLVAGTVGGIMANSTRPAEFIYDNMMIHATVVHSSHLFRVKKLLYLGSSCIYPRLSAQPMKEEELLSGSLEPTNEAYAIAKIAGIKLCQSYRQQYGSDFISAMPTNLYGPNDNFDLTSSHVLPAMIRKFHDAREEGRQEVVMWGTGTPRREMLYSDDMADACVALMELPDADFDRLLGNDPKSPQPPLVNIGWGEDYTIRELAERVRDVSIAVYQRIAEHALERGVILADTKFEFGFDSAGVLTLGDEVATPDSSRFWPADSYEPGRSQPSFDKQYVRDWAAGTGWDKAPPAPAIPDDVVRQTRERYVKAYETLTGEPFSAWLERTGA